MRDNKLFLSAALGLFSALPLAAVPANSFELEWNCKNDTTLPYEIVIDRVKLDKLAGIPQNSAIKAVAVVKNEEKDVETKLIPGNTSGKEILRLIVPAGTEKLYAAVCEKEKTLCCVNTVDNLLAGALNDTKNWKASDGSTKFFTSGKKLNIDVNIFGNSTARYFVDLPEGYAGTPAVFELELTSRAKLTWGGAVRVEQYDSKGKLLPESLTEPRWISHMRIPGVTTHYQEYGFFHKDAKKIAVTFVFQAAKHAFDNHGLPVKNAKDSLPKLAVSKLAVRKAQELPFPAYNNALFAKGVSGKVGDTALVLDGNSIFHYSPNSHAVYSEAKQIKSEKECFWPLNDATVEAWVNPQWSKRERKAFILVDARNNYGPRKAGKAMRKKISTLFSVSYTPVKKQWNISIQDGTDSRREFSFKYAMPLKKWSHVAVQYGKGGVECFINGKKVFCDDKYNYTPRVINREFPYNDQIAQIVAVGNSSQTARDKMVTSPKAQVDLVRVSGGKRYSGDFVPGKTAQVDDKTFALFDFDRSIDGKTANGLGKVYGSINSTAKFLKERTFSYNGKTVQYFPAKLLKERNPQVVLNTLNYPDMPTVSDFKAARKDNVVKYSAKSGERKELTVPANSHMNYIEIACPENVKELRHPVLIANQELDVRSFGDIADSLKDIKVSDYEKANMLFNLVLKASDYFMTHQATIIPHSNAVKHASYQALTLFNSYCGFECGPLNNMAANMFSCSGGLPATQTSGYGHSFQQVYFDGKNHVYDLSAQMFFPGFDNETPASLKELDRENGAFQAWGKGGGSSFSRQGATRGYSLHVPGMQKRIAYTLHPGEKARFYFYNDGNYNDIQVKRCIDKRAVHPNDPFPYPIEYRLAQKAPKELVSKEQLYQVHRPFPHYSNAYFTFSGKPSKDNGAFSKITEKDFCYEVELPYPIVAGKYNAVTVDGKQAEIEISTDGGKSFRKLFTEADGRAVYAVRARYAYFIKVKAPIDKIDRFEAYTEVMFNSRVQNCKLKEGNNSILFKAESGSDADVTISYRNDTKSIEIKDAPYSGAMPGFERQITAVEPGKSVSHAVVGVSANAKVICTDGITAKLDGEKLVVSAKKGLVSPRFDNVVIDDDGAKKELVVLVSENVRLVLAKDARLIKGGKMVAANADTVQDCAVVKDSAQVAFDFAEIPAGDYTIWVLSRMDTNEARARTSRKEFSRELSVVLPGGKHEHSITGINSGTEFFKAKYGKGKGRFRWDAPIDNDHNKYPYFSPRWTALDKCRSLTFQANKWHDIEIAAILVTPRTDNATRCELVKVLCGLNCEPWKIAREREK